MVAKNKFLNENPVKGVWGKRLGSLGFRVYIRFTDFRVQFEYCPQSVTVYTRAIVKRLISL